LTKALGIGVLLAAHMRSLCPAAAFDQLIETMLSPQHDWAPLAAKLELAAGTDVTGFGLLGHLVEMTRASRVGAVVDLQSVPVLPGAIQLIQDGIASSLLPENRRFDRWVEATEAVRKSPAYEILLDPQTCGGLLLGVPADKSAAFTEAAEVAGLPIPVRIGQVEEGDGTVKIRV